MSVLDNYRLRRVAVLLAGLACACVGLAITASAAFAQVLGSPGDGGTPAGLVREALLRGEDLAPVSRSGRVPSFATVTRTVMVGGTPGWQIALITVGAALLTATLAVRADRARAAHGRVLASQRCADGRGVPPGVLELGGTPEDGGPRDLLEQTGLRLRAERLTRPRN